METSKVHSVTTNHLHVSPFKNTSLPPQIPKCVIPSQHQAQAKIQHFTVSRSHPFPNSCLPQPMRSLSNQMGYLFWYCSVFFQINFIEWILQAALYTRRGSSLHPLLLAPERLSGFKTVASALKSCQSFFKKSIQQLISFLCFLIQEKINVTVQNGLAWGNPEAATPSRTPSQSGVQQCGPKTLLWIHSITCSPVSDNAANYFFLRFYTDSVQNIVYYSVIYHSIKLLNMTLTPSKCSVHSNHYHITTPLYL